MISNKSIVITFIGLFFILLTSTGASSLPVCYWGCSDFPPEGPGCGEGYYCNYITAQCSPVPNPGGGTIMEIAACSPCPTAGMDCPSDGCNICHGNLECKKGYCQTILATCASARGPEGDAYCARLDSSKPSCCADGVCRAGCTACSTCGTSTCTESKYVYYRSTATYGTCDPGSCFESICQ